MHLAPKPVLMSLALLCASCSSERTVYGPDGAVVRDRAPGDNSSLEERFTGSFKVRKNKDGVPEASSTRVSPFQSQIDAAREAGQGDAAAVAGKQFGGRQDISDLRDRGYAGAGNQFTGSKSYAGSGKSAYTPDKVPDFLKPGKGLERKDYAKGAEVHDADRQHEAAAAYAKVVSPTTPSQTSGYIESRRDKTPPPVIMSREDYQRMSLEESRGLLGRDRNAQ